MWFKSDDRLLDSPEVLAIPSRYRAAAMGVWTLCGTWLCGHPNDDRFVPDAVIDANGGRKLRRYLLLVGFWDEAPGGIIFNEIRCRIGTASDAQDDRDGARERMRRMRERRRTGDAGDEQGTSTGAPRAEHGQSTDAARAGPQPADQDESVHVTPSHCNSVTPEFRLGIGNGSGSSNHLPTEPSPGSPELGTSPARARPDALTEASALINAAKPQGQVLGRRVRRALHECVVELLGDGAEPADMREVLDEWFATADVYPGHLGHMHTELVKRRNGVLRQRDSHGPEINGHRLTRTDERVLELQRRNAADRAATQRKALE